MANDCMSEGTYNIDYSFFVLKEIETCDLTVIFRVGIKNKKNGVRRLCNSPCVPNIYIKPDKGDGSYGIFNIENPKEP